jgi:hypothetical protein
MQRQQMSFSAKSMCFTLVAAVSLMLAGLVAISWARGRAHFVWYSVRPSHGPGGVSYESPHAVALVIALLLPGVWTWWACRALRRRRTLIHPTRQRSQQSQVMPSDLAHDSFRRLLELYVLRSIGELPPDAPVLAKISELLRRAGHGDDWIQFVERTMEFDRSMPQIILDNWRKNSRRAVEGGVTLSPADFATNFVAANFI